MAKPAEAAKGRRSALANPHAKRERRLITPEGAYLTLRLASPSDRIGAAALDFAVVSIASAAIVILIVVVSPSGLLSGLTQALALLAAFVFRVFYYPALEFAWGGQTVGKRSLAIRVVDRRGGPLKPESIIARNFLREIELYLPLSALFSFSAANSGEAWIGLLTVAWLLILSSFPLFTRDVMRLGDMVAGTWVVHAPKAELLPDLAVAKDVAPGAGSEPIFSKSQLDPYGEYELEVLANVLRDRTKSGAQLLPEVAARIQKKIGWEGTPSVNARTFLLAYYRALRGHLEGKLIFGKRKLDKYNID